MSIQLFIWALIAGVAATVNYCSASETTDKLEMLGDSLDDLETAPLGAQVRVEGKLTGDNTLANPALDRNCLAYYLEVTLVSESSDSDGNTDHHYYRVFKEVRGPDTLVVTRGRVKAALPLRYWTRYHKTRDFETGKWPSWLDPRHKISSYTGSFDRYDIETLCLESGATLFLAGSIAAVTEADHAEATSDRLMEIRNPLISLRPSPGFGPVDVWPGTEADRIGSLIAYRGRKRSYAVILTVVGGLLLLIGVIVARSEF